MKKLSKAQIKLLEDLTKYDSFLHYMGRFNPYPYYFMDKTLKTYWTETVEPLIKSGYLIANYPFANCKQVYLTEKGKVLAMGGTDEKQMV